MNNSIPSTPPPLPADSNRLLPETRFHQEPLPSEIGPLAIVEAILKSPGRLFYEVRSGRTGQVQGYLLLITLICLGAYGIVVGSLSGSAQLWIAPIKILLGVAASTLICLPSLYIFLCLGGTDAKLREVTGASIAMVSLMSLILLGMAPIVWVFSQSTDSVGLMTFLHLLFWAIALALGARLLTRGMNQKGGISLWIAIYLIVSLQMMTALRPIIGQAETFLPQKKEFFLTHLVEVAKGK